MDYLFRGYDSDKTLIIVRYYKTSHINIYVHIL